MTAQLSREDIRELRSDLSSWQEDYSPTLDAEQYQLFGRAMVAMDMLLAGMDSDKKLRDFAASQTTLGADVERALAGSLHELYLGDDTAPPAPVAVPDELTREEYKRRFMEEDNFDDTYRGGWNAFRAAMLKHQSSISSSAGAGCSGEIKQPSSNEPVTGWIKCSERMPGTVGLYCCCVDEDKTSGKRNCVINCLWDGNGWDEPALRALGGTVTHWMPLPAAPEQEV